jgi:mono/diheme cytochrome c family protein
MRSQVRLTATLSMLLLFATACRGNAGNTAGGTQNAQTGGQASPPPAVLHEEHVFAGGIPPAGSNLRNPYAGDKSAAEAGAKLFTQMNCDGCHGGGATGWVGPSLTARRWRFGGSDADVFQTIYYGRPHGMPAFGGLLPQNGIWQIVAYIRSLPPPKDVPTESW